MFAVILLAIFVGRVSWADPVREIFVNLERPIAVRGGTLLLPLSAERPGDQWPATITLTLADGTELEGDVIWMYADGKPPDLHWTSDILGLHVRPIEPTDDSSSGRGSVFLAALLPPDASGAIRVLRDTLSPQWFDKPLSPTRWETDQVVVETLPRRAGPDRPDVDSPFEYWRWVQLADRYGIAPPPPPGSRIQRLVATYYADLWRLGMERIAIDNADVARECRMALTRIVRDGVREFAAWVADPPELSRLLSVLLDFDLTGRELTQEVRDWLTIRQQIFYWIERDHGDQIHLAVVNADEAFILAEFRWEFLDPARNAREFPIGIGLEPGQLTRVVLDRPQVMLDAIGRPIGGAPPLLQVRWRDEVRRFSVRPPASPALPPGLYLFPFHPPLALAEVRRGDAAMLALDRGTSIVLRRLGGRWELFMTCFRPKQDERLRDPLLAEGEEEDPEIQAEIERRLQEAADAAMNGETEGETTNSAPPPLEVDREQYPLAGLNRVEEVRGREAVTLFLGSEEEPFVVLTIPEVGPQRQWVGVNDGTLQVHRRSYEDRWYCRLVLPDAWLGYPVEPGVLMGFIRSHSDTDTIETSPNPIPSWSFDPGRIYVDTTLWSDLPR